MSPSATERPAHRRSAPVRASIVAGVVFAAGLWISLHYTLGVWSLDPDTAVPLAWWEGLRQHGLGFVSSWYYTPDNWLLSLLPMSSLVFEALGTSPPVVIGIGWMIFVASVLMTAWLAHDIAGPRFAMLVAGVLIFASVDALGRVGFMAHPVTHNISMAWALLSLILTLRAVRRGEILTAILVGLCIFADVLSDPWAGPAIAAPLVLACGLIAWLHRGQPASKGALAVIGATLIGFVVATTHAFGALSFLSRPNVAFTSLGGMASNGYWALRAFTHMFNIVPGADADGRAVKIVDAVAIVLVLGGSIVWTLRAIRGASLARQLITAVAILSIAAVGAAYLIGVWDPNLNVGRFFPNVYFFGALLMVAALSEYETPAPRWGRAAIVAFALLFVAAGVASRPSLWLKPQPARGLEQARGLGEFLHAHGLSYGYGPYWGAYTLVMGPATEGKVTIRPVTFRYERVERRRAETSSYWFQPQDEPTAEARRFLVVRNDGEECPSVSACVAVASRQFGAPAETLTYQDATILVWPRSIAAGVSR